MKCGSKRTLEIKNVKLFEFLSSLLAALRESDRNLNKECFKYEIMGTTMSYKPINSFEDLKTI
jgi:hypothetical protein